MAMMPDSSPPARCARDAASKNDASCFALPQPFPIFNLLSCVSDFPEFPDSHDHNAHTAFRTIAPRGNSTANRIMKSLLVYHMRPARSSPFPATPPFDNMVSPPPCYAPYDTRGSSLRPLMGVSDSLQHLRDKFNPLFSDRLRKMKEGVLRLTRRMVTPPLRAGFPRGKSVSKTRAQARSRASEGRLYFRIVPPPHQPSPEARPPSAGNQPPLPPLDRGVKAMPPDEEVEEKPP